MWPVNLFGVDEGRYYTVGDESAAHETIQGMCDSERASAVEMQGFEHPWRHGQREVGGVPGGGTGFRQYFSDTDTGPIGKLLGTDIKGIRV